MKNKKLSLIISVGLMAALVFVGNYIQVKIPNGVLITRIHFGNSMCLLAGLLFGGPIGGLASGLGAALYDVLDPVYIVSAPFTFLSKFAMAFICGILASRIKNHDKTSKTVTGVIISAVLGQITYIVMYLSKTYITQIILGYEVQTALSATLTNAITSSVNAIIAVAVSVPLFFALKKPLMSTYFAELITAKPKNNAKWYVWAIIIVLFSVVSFAAIYMNAIYKLSH